MRPVRDFSEFLDDATVAQRSPDPLRAQHLRSEALRTQRTLVAFVDGVGVDDGSANTVIKIAYDAIMELVRAEMHDRGYSASGHGAHEAEVAFLRVLGRSEADVQFCDQLRYFRNGIMYYGKSFDAQYARKVLGFLDGFF